MIPMEWSEEGRTKLVLALSKAQAEMAAVVKGSDNPAFKSKYADLASVLEAVLPALNKHGFALIQSPSFDGEVVSVETFLAHSDGGWLRSILALRPTKADPQGVGSATTYARRYALMALAGVAPEDDDGNAASSPGTPGKPFARPQAAEARRAPPEPSQAPPAANPIDRSGEPVPVPADDATVDEWSGWRKIVATKIGKANSGADIDTVQKVNAEGITKCNLILDDTVSLLAEYVQTRRLKLGETVAA